jgi:hypothetical protein
MALLAAAGPTSHAQGKKKKAATAAQPVPQTGGTAPKSKKARVFDFGAMSFEGTMRTPQLLYFLGRVKQELDRAALEKRSFMPELVRSVDEGGL